MNQPSSTPPVSSSTVSSASAVAGEPELEYTVVLNHEEQYSIWPTFREVPAGWREVGVRGAKAMCLEHIEAVWTDMRPASLRRYLAGLGDAA
ncbi:MbtH family NRPS accessory protein [Paraburkholderia bonniea]|uniref:MbtH family protein n=1 Tax=Paraburkholderia bonniea TaxID=2152891 RepID=UPI001291C9DE|nr:MbtH family NRPS accessory protein [Paraburkholderia bonniea]WJF91881.1 MbtH family NRPS accessory protein [Paraburkholderia bonniea]WJF95200.1 MbtH family NRPS accessory protein [Paraburkholderia bonniea]